jgi:hypothetical protein
MRGFIMSDSHYADLESQDAMVVLKAKIREEMIQKLAAEWNQINNRLENNYFLMEDERDHLADYLAEMCQESVYKAVCEAKQNNPSISKEELRDVRQMAEDSFYDEISKKDQEVLLRKQVIEELLSELGARMARPYEHWNEMESYMEYQENRYDSEYRDW